MSRPHVVIVGGGFAGLHAARALRRAPVDITLIDRRNHHLFQPMLYQVAMAALAPNDIAAPIRSVLAHQRNTEVVMGEVERVDRAGRSVHLLDGTSMTYDYLVLAPGTRHSYFGNDHWESLAPGLKSIEDAEEVRRRMLLAFEAAEREPNPEERHAYLNFVVVGGGPTGVEVAGALAEVRRYALARDFRAIDPRAASVVLLEAGPRLLPSYPERLSRRALHDLERLGVHVRLGTAVTNIEPGQVTAGRGTIPTHNVVWAAGNAASPVLATLETELDRNGRALVSPDCTIPGDPRVFVVGDAARFVPRDASDPLPALCPVAIQQGRFVGQAIAREINGKKRSSFSYFDKGQLAVIGRGRAVADIWKLEFGGLLAWLIWIFVHIAFLIGFRNRVVVLTEWAISYVTYKRGARLITDEHPTGNPAAALSPR